MSKAFQTQLKKLDIPIESYTEPFHYFIRKFDSSKLPVQLLQVGKSYEIEFLNTDRSKELASIASMNWNSGRVLEHSIIVCEVIKLSGEMIQVNGIGKNSSHTSSYFSYWIDQKTIKQITAI